MSVSWPEMLPSPRVNNYSFTQEDNTVRSAMETGASRVRRRFTHPITKVNLQWIMGQDQFAYFESWFKYKLQSGAVWFRVEIFNGCGLNSVDARFLKPYSVKLISHQHWEVSGNLEIREVAVISEEVLDLTLSMGLESRQNFVTLSNDLHHLIHTSMTLEHPW